MSNSTDDLLEKAFAGVSWTFVIEDSGNDQEARASLREKVLQDRMTIHNLELDNQRLEEERAYWEAEAQRLLAEMATLTPKTL